MAGRSGASLGLYIRPRHPMPEVFGIDLVSEVFRTIRKSDRCEGILSIEAIHGFPFNGPPGASILDCRVGCLPSKIDQDDVN